MIEESINIYKETAEIMEKVQIALGKKILYKVVPARVGIVVNLNEDDEEIDIERKVKNALKQKR